MIEQLKEKIKSYYVSDDIDKILDCITNLQQEINKLTAESTEWESKYYDLQQENERLKEKIKEQNLLLIEFQDMEQKLDIYKSRCKKAIEYIMSELITEWDIENNGCVSGSDLSANAITPILDILNGSDENE